MYIGKGTWRAELAILRKTKWIGRQSEKTPAIEWKAQSGVLEPWGK